MNALENQIVVYKPDETVRLDRELYLVGASLEDLGKKYSGFNKMGKGEIRQSKKKSFA